MLYIKHPRVLQSKITFFCIHLNISRILFIQGIDKKLLVRKQKKLTKTSHHRSTVTKKYRRPCITVITLQHHAIKSSVKSYVLSRIIIFLRTIEVVFRIRMSHIKHCKTL